MARSSAEFWSDRFLSDTDSDEFVNGVTSTSSNGNSNSNGSRGCNCGGGGESARALQQILRLLDNLNERDLCTLKKVVDRMVCEL